MELKEFYSDAVMLKRHLMYKNGACCKLFYFDKTMKKMICPKEICSYFCEKCLFRSELSC